MHWLLDPHHNYLLKAVARGKRATSREQLAKRLRILTRKDVTVADVDEAMGILRGTAGIDPGCYGWTIAHATRGVDDTDRRYIPVLIDTDENNDLFYWCEDDDRPYAVHGFFGTIKEATTKLANASIAFEYAASTFTKPADKRKARGLAASAQGISQMAEQLAADVAKMAI